MDENSPLLAAELGSQAGDKHEKLTYTSELGKLARNMFPIAISFGLQNIVQAFSVLTVGRLGTLELGAASYGYMFATCTGSMLAVGGATTLDTLCSQALHESKASGNSQVLGIYLQRGIMILVIMFLCLIAPVWWVSADLFIALGQENDFAVMTATFLRILIPGGLLQAVAECIKKFLQVQGESDAVGWNIAAAAIIGCIANYVLVHLLNLGLWGAPLAHTLYHLCTVIFLFTYTYRSENANQGWGGFSKKSLDSWGEFIALAISGILTNAAEAWR
jgi:MATE family multidrug resistance protein